MRDSRASSSQFAPADFPLFSATHKTDQSEIPKKLIVCASATRFSGAQSAPQPTHTHTKGASRGVEEEEGVQGEESVWRVRLGWGRRQSGPHINTFPLLPPLNLF